MRSYCLTDVGRIRKLNEDFVYASDQPVGRLENLYMVADGMGGYNAGEVASRCAVETVVSAVRASDQVKVPMILADAVRAANEAVMQKAAEDKSMAGMGTTLVVCTSVGDSLYIANVGDSRLYLISDVIEQMTVDHSLVEEMIRSGQISREQARSHEKKNVITRAIGVTNHVRCDLFDAGLLQGDTILLCSDGLTNMLTDEEIRRVIRKTPSLEEAAGILVEKANNNGGTDNISVILIRYDGAGDTLC